MKIYCLLDYKDNFISKYDSRVYRSGMDKILLKQHFGENEIEIEFLNYVKIQNYEPAFWKNKKILYTSSEDYNFLYKAYIEDIAYYLEINGAQLIPDFKYLKANNNKVFMELLIKMIIPNTRAFLQSRVYGCLEEMHPEIKSLKFPQVYKKAAGAMSNGVGMAYNRKELISSLKKISKSIHIVTDIKDKIRRIKHSQYRLESTHRSKFILQEFVPDLDGDYKILIFWNQYYVLKRGVKENDFRASGSGIRSFEKNIPDGLLQYAKDIFTNMQIPNVSLDIASNGKEYFLIEFQALHFGTYTLIKSDFHWVWENDEFVLVEGKTVLEKVYAHSISKFIRNR